MEGFDKREYHSVIMAGLLHDVLEDNFSSAMLYLDQILVRQTFLILLI